MTLYISPYRRIARLRQEMDRLLDDNYADEAKREMTLAVDVQANEDDYIVKALVPGLEADDLNIEILNNTVSIRGEFKSSFDEEDVKYLSCELPNGSFSRLITLPTALDPAKAEASMKNGVLTLRIPKAEAHRPKTIKIAAG